MRYFRIYAQLVALAAIILLVSAGSDASAQCNSREWQKVVATDGSAGDWFGDRVAIDGDVIVVGADEDDDAGEQSGSAYVYRYDGTGWILEQKLTASDGAAHTRFGIAVAVSGDVIVIGADQDHGVAEYAGAAYVFRHDGISWVEEQKLTGSDEEYWDWFGWAVAIDGDVIAVGANGQEDGGGDYYNSGAVYMFRFDGQNWIEEDKLTAIDAGPGTQFGFSVSVSGDVLMVSTPMKDDAGPRTGAGYAFRYRGSTWEFEQKLMARDAHLMDSFGCSVDLEGDVAVFGAWGESRGGGLVLAGAAYVFQFNGREWRQQDKLIASDAEGNDHFGNCVSISDDLILIGCRYDNLACPSSQNCNSGSAYLYQNSGHGGWKMKGKLTPSDKAYFDNFGQYVALSSHRAVVGALHDDDKGQDSGSAYIYHSLSDCDGNRAMDFCDIAWNPSLDADGNGVLDSCEGSPGGELTLDIKPGACPNRFVRHSQGVLLAALAASPGFDVHTIDTTSLTMARADGVGGTVTPMFYPVSSAAQYRDLATPYEGPDCTCDNLGADGITDLVLKFRGSEIDATLELGNLSAGSAVELVVSGTLVDGTPFAASDCLMLMVDQIFH